MRQFCLALPEPKMNAHNQTTTSGPLARYGWKEGRPFVQRSCWLSCVAPWRARSRLESKLHGRPSIERISAIRVRNLAAFVSGLPTMASQVCPGASCRWSQTLARGVRSALLSQLRVHRRPLAEADIQRHFGVTPPSVHQMILTLERAGLIRRQSGVPRSVEVLVPPEDLPVLLAHIQPVRTSVPRY